MTTMVTVPTTDTKARLLLCMVVYPEFLEQEWIRSLLVRTPVAAIPNCVSFAAGTTLTTLSLFLL